MSMTEMQQIPSPRADWLPTAGHWRAVTPMGRSALDTIAADPSGVLLALDFDGTLAPIVDDPSTSRMEARSRAALDALGGQLGQLAIVTGRSVAVVRQLGRFDEPGFDRLVVMGQYGQERWDAATDTLDVPPEPIAVRQALVDLRALLADEIDGAGLEGVTLEDKGRAIGVHTRRAVDPDGAHERLRVPVADIADAHGLLVEPGRRVWELRSSSISKGDALEHLVERVRPRVVVMMGDDLGDLPAFEYVESLASKGIVGIRVVSASPEQPTVAEHADVLCGQTTGIAAWLEALADRVGSRPA